MRTTNAMRREAIMRIIGSGLLAGVMLLAGAARAGEPCRDWAEEHESWRATSLRRTLDGSAPSERDAALFELVQREAYLTACPEVGPGQQSSLIGWRLVGRSPAEYGSVVAESVLEQGGFDLSLRSLLGPALSTRSRRASR